MYEFIFGTLFGTLFTIIGAVVTVQAHRLEKQRRTDAWLQTFQEIHAAFWGDADYAAVREWLSSRESYEDRARDVLFQRSSGKRISHADYHVLEKLDKFLNLLQRALAVHQELRGSHLWDHLFFGFWLERVLRDDTPELQWYVTTFYPDLVEATKLWRRSLPEPRYLPTAQPESLQPSQDSAVVADLGSDMNR